MANSSQEAKSGSVARLVLQSSGAFDASAKAAVVRDRVAEIFDDVTMLIINMNEDHLVGLTLIPL